jgi:putative addiction module component (TIGR02574 family)
MSEAEITELLKLPAEERLRLVEAIWESLSVTPADVPLGDAHREAIAAELAEHRRNPNDVLSLDQVLAGIRRSR